MSKMPIIAIVGRANVGKSSLFNRMVGARQAIVANEAGTTRDSVTGVMNLGTNQKYRVVDTAGLKRAEDEFEASIQDQIIEATQAADLILLVVEAGIPMTDEDHRVAKMALKSEKPVLLLMNKVDQAHGQELDRWAKTGVKTRIKTSAIHGTGLEQLENYIKKHVPSHTEIEDNPPLRIALIGRPNVGKSHLFNTLARKQQAVVANFGGTTRDVNRVQINYHGQAIEILDTAGVRRPGKVERGIEHFSVLRTMAAIDEADVCLLLMDANELNVAMDQKLAGIIADSGKPLVLTVSKWDLIEKDTHTQPRISRWIARNFQHVAWAPLIFTSAVTGQNTTRIYDLASETVERAQQKFETKELNKLLRKAMATHPPSGPAGKRIHPKLKYMTQTGSKPPEFTVFGHKAKSTHWSYQRFLEKAIRANWELEGVPLNIWFKDN